MWPFWVPSLYYENDANLSCLLCVIRYFIRSTKYWFKKQLLLQLHLILLASPYQMSIPLNKSPWLLLWFYLKYLEFNFLPFLFHKLQFYDQLRCKYPHKKIFLGYIWMARFLGNLRHWWSVHCTCRETIQIILDEGNA